MKKIKLDNTFHLSSTGKKYFPHFLIIFGSLPIYSMFRTGEFSFNHSFTAVFCFIYAIVLFTSKDS